MCIVINVLYVNRKTIDEHVELPGDLKNDINGKGPGQDAVLSHLIL